MTDPDTAHGPVDDTVLLRDPYLEWVAAEGLPVAGGFGVDLLEMETKFWPRAGVEAGFAHVDGRGDFLTISVLDIAPKQSTIPQRHLFESVVYVLSGRGATTVTLPGGGEHTFEWGPKSLFSLPLNSRHQHFNLSSSERTRVASVMDLPLAMKLYRDPDFVFDNPYDFTRVSAVEAYGGDGELVPGLLSRQMWRTNFVPDLANFGGLTTWAERGAGGTNMFFLMGDGKMHAHMSEMPVGTYKKAHWHTAGAHVFAVTGVGYSLYWYPGDEDFGRIDWKHGFVYAPAYGQFHQHFNSGTEPSRYLAGQFGNSRYPMTQAQAESFLGAASSVVEGGGQIEYEDQDPRIHQMYVEELAKHGLEPRMKAFVKG